jgi:hypothetical protein
MEWGLVVLHNYLGMWLSIKATDVGLSPLTNYTMAGAVILL